MRAIDLANYVVSKRIPGMNRLRLQLVMYYAYAEYPKWKLGRDELFDDEIRMFKLGPNIQDIHEGFQVWSTKDLKEPIRRLDLETMQVVDYSDSLLTGIDRFYMDSILDATKDLDVWSLVYLATSEPMYLHHKTAIDSGTFFGCYDKEWVKSYFSDTYLKEYLKQIEDSVTSTYGEESRYLAVNVSGGSGMVWYCPSRAPLVTHVGKLGGNWKVARIE